MSPFRFISLICRVSLFELKNKNNFDFRYTPKIFPLNWTWEPSMYYISEFCTGGEKSQNQLGGSSGGSPNQITSCCECSQWWQRVERCTLHAICYPQLLVLVVVLDALWLERAQMAWGNQWCENSWRKRKDCLGWISCLGWMIEKVVTNEISVLNLSWGTPSSRGRSIKLSMKQ